MPTVARLFLVSGRRMRRSSPTVGMVTEHYLGLEIGDPEHVRLHGHCRLGEQDSVVSPSEIAEFGPQSVSETPSKKAVAQASEAAESVKGFTSHLRRVGTGKGMSVLSKATN